DAAPSRLVFTRLEAEEISTELPRRWYTGVYGAEFNKTAVRSGFLNEYQYIHFATHARDVNNVSSGGALSSSFFNERGEPIPHSLTSREIEQLELTGQVITLSACRSGGGRQITGEGMIGLTRAFLYAGARTVI